MSGAGPIFIGGLSHSGKTEMRMILEAHPNICMTRRTRMWDRFVGTFGDLEQTENLERCLEAMVEDDGVLLLQPDLARIRSAFRDGPATYGRLFELFHQHHALRMGKRRWGEQVGFIERFADDIFETIPSARMIHMVRDPRARYAEASLKSQRRRRGALGWETAMWLWSADLAIRNRRRYSRRYLVIRFESLESNPEGTARATCAFLEEPWAPQMREVIDALTFDSSGKAKRRTVEDAFLEKYAGHHLEAFDYSIPVVADRRRDPLPFLFVDRPFNRAAMVACRVLAGSQKQRNGSWRSCNVDRSS